MSETRKCKKRDANVSIDFRYILLQIYAEAIELRMALACEMKMDAARTTRGAMSDVRSFEEIMRNFGFLKASCLSAKTLLSVQMEYFLSSWILSATFSVAKIGQLQDFDLPSRWIVDRCSRT